MVLNGIAFQYQYHFQLNKICSLITQIS